MKEQKYILILAPVLLSLVAILSYLKITNVKNDTEKFVNEYEKLNNTNYKIDTKNIKNVKYSSYDEVFNIIKSDTAIIYLGYPDDDNSRYLVDTLFKTIIENSIETTVYYLDIHGDRDEYTIENDKLVYEKDENGKELKGTHNYFKLMGMLDEYLGEYVLYLDDKEYSTNEKRIPLPSVIFIKDGKILGIEYASIDIPLEDLNLNIENYLLNMYSTSCDVGKENPC